MNPYSTQDRPPGTEALPTTSDIAPTKLENSNAVPSVIAGLESKLPTISDLSQQTTPQPDIFEAQEAFESGQTTRPKQLKWVVGILLLFATSGLILSAYVEWSSNRKQATTDPNLSSLNSSALLADDKNQNLHINFDTTINNGKTLKTTGPVIIQNEENSTSALAVQNAAGSDLLVVDTKNSVVGIGAKPVAGGAQLQVAGNISTQGSLQASSGGSSLSNQGLVINSVLVCTSAGCISSTAQNTPDLSTFAKKTDLAGLAQLSGNQTFTGANTFNVQLQAAGGIDSTGYKVNGTSGTGLSCSPGEVLQQPTFQGGIITSGSCVTIAGGTTPTLQQVYDVSTPATMMLTGGNGPLSVQDAASPLGTNLFQVTNNSGATKYFAVTSAGVKITGNTDTTGLYLVNGVQINSGNLSNDANLAKLSANQTFAGNNTFSSASNSFTGSGAGLTALNASNISSGTLNDARLSANVALLNGTGPQTFTGNNKFTGTFLAQNAANSTTAFQIQNVAGTSNLFIADTTNSRIGIGKAPTLGTLDVNGNIFQNGSQVCDTSGNCAGVAGIGGSGTAGTIPVFTGSGLTIGDSLLSQAAGTVTVNGNLNLTAGNQYRVNGSQISSTNLSNDANLAKLNGNQTFSGNNTFSSASNSFTGDGSGLTSLNASNVSSGTLNDGRLSSNVPLKNAANTFTNTNAFQSASATGLQVQNSGAADTLFTVDTTARGAGGGNLVKIGNSTGTDGNTTVLVVDSATANPSSNLGALNGGLFYNSTTNHINVIENGSVKELCNKTDLGCGSAGATQTLAVVYANGANQTDETILLDSTRNGVLVRDNGTPITGTLFGVQNSTGATKYLDVTASGASVAGAFTATGNINTTGGQFQVNGSQISSANLSNDANLAKLNGNQTFSGNNTFSSASNSFTGDGSGLTSLNASNISSGTLNDGRLSSNVPLKNAANTFTNTNAIQVTSATSFQVQSASAADTMLAVDTSARGVGGGNLVKIGNSTGTDGNTTILVVDSATANPSSNLGVLSGGLFYNSTTNHLNVIENGSVKELCNKTDLGCGSAGATQTLAVVYANGASQTDETILLDSTRNGVLIRDNGTPITGTLFGVQNSTGGTKYLDVTTTGATVAGAFTSTGNINSSGGAIQTNGTTRIDNSGNLSNIGNVSLSGTISGGTTITGSGNINSTGGALQTNSTTRVDNSGNLTNIGNLTTTGASTFATTGANGFTFKPGSNVATAVQVQNAAASETLFAVDTTTRGAGGGNLVKIGNSTGTDGNTTILVVDSATADPTSNLGALNGGLFYNSSSNHLSVIENGVVKELCNKTDLGCGSAGTTQTLATVYSNGSNQTDSTILLDSTRGGVLIKDNATPLGSSLFSVQDSTGGTAYLDVTDAGISVSGRIDGTTIYQNGNQVCDTSGNCVGTGGGGAIGGGGTANTIAKFTGSGFTVGDSLITDNGTKVTIGGQLDVSSSLATKKGTDFSTTGTSNNVSFSDASLIRLTGASAQTITGIANGRDGYVLTLVNAGSATATISNNSGSSSAANRITTGTGADYGLPVGSGITLIYDSSASLWRLAATGTGVNSIGTINSQTKSADGAVIVGNNLVLQTADASFPGLVSTTTQTWAGDKTFSGLITGNAGLTVSGGAVSLTGNGASSLTTTAGALSLQGDGGVTLSTTNKAGALTNNITIATGNVTSGAFASGNISIDVGTSTGTTGTISLGSANVSAITIGHSGITTTNNGALTVAQTLTANGGISVGSGQSFSFAGGASNFDQSASSGTFQTGSGNVSLNGATTVTGTNNFTVNGGNTSLGGDLDVTKSFATKKGTDFSTTGTSNNVNFGDVSLVRLTGASAQTITGVANGRDGYNLFIVNAAGQSATISNNSGSSSAANRITTGTGADYTLPSGAGIELIYDSVASLWRMAATGTGVNAIGTLDSQSKSADGAVVVGSSLVLQTADGSFPGLVSTGSQTFAGAKDFTSNSTTGFQIQNASSPDNLFVADTTNHKIGFAMTPSTTGAVLQVTGATGNSYILSSQAVGDVLPKFQMRASGALEWGDGTGATDTDLYRPLAGVLRTDNYFQVDTITDSATAFRVMDHTAADVLVADTSNKRVAVNQTTASYTLDVAGDINTSANVRTGGTIRINNSGNLTNIGTITLSGSISGGTTVTGSGNFNTTGGSIQTNSTTRIDNSGNLTNINDADLAGSFATKKGTDYSTTGTSNNVNFGDVSLVRLTGASAQTITGVANGRDGYNLFIVNAGSNAATISNNSGSSSAANRITTGTGADYSLPVGAGIELIYDSVASLWRMAATGTGVNGIGTIDSQTKSADGAVVVGSNLVLQTADASFPGLVSTGVQTFAGAKTFTALLTGSAGLTVSGGAVSLTGNGASSLTTTSGALTLQGDGGLTASTTNKSGAATNNITIATGNVTSGGFASGNVSIDVGTSTGTTGTISLGNANASAITIGHSGITTTNAGALTVTQTLTANGSISVGSGQSFSFAGGASNFDQSASSGTFQTGTGNVTLNGNVTVAGTNTFTVNGGNTSLGADLDVTSSVAFKHGTDISTTGTLDDLSISDSSLLRLSGASAQTLDGIAGGRDGRILTIINVGTANLTIADEAAGSTAANRIRTGTGGNISVAVNSSTTLVYDSQASRWRVVGDVAGGAGAGVTSIGTFTSCTSYANGAQISSNTLTFSCADASNPGMVSTGAQTWAGAKTFNNLLTGSAGLTVTGGAVSLTGNNNSSLTTSAGTLSLQGFSTTNLTTANRSAANTADINITTGNVTSGSNTSGSISIDVGTSTGTKGSISIGNGNASAVVLGSIAGAAQTVIQSGTGNLTLAPSGGSNTGVIVKPGADSTNAFLLQNAAGTSNYIKADTSGAVLSLGNTGIASTIQIGNTTGAVAQTVNVGNNATASSTTTLVAGSTVGSSTTTIQGGTGNINLVTNAAGAGTTVKTNTNSVTAFQVQNSTGTQLINIDTTNPVTDLTTNGTQNLITNGSFEGTNGTTGWAAYNGAETIAQTSSLQFIGNSSLSVTTTAAANRGAKYSLTTTTLASNTKYNLTLSVRLASGTSMSTLKIGRADNGASDTDCLSAQTVSNTSWTTFNCSFTTGTTSSTPYIYIKQSDATARTFYIDGVQLTRFSLLANASVEQAITASDWQSLSSGTVTRDTTQFYDGAASLKIVTATSNNRGAKQNITLQDNTSYTLSFYALGNSTFSTVEAGYAADGATETACMTALSVRASSWNPFSCTFTTPSSHSGTPYLYIKDTSTGHTWFVDVLQLTMGNPLGNGYSEGKISLNGIVNSPLLLQNQSDSTNAFQLQNGAGVNVLSADTANQRVTVASTGWVPTLMGTANSTFSGGAGRVAVQGKYVYVPDTGNAVLRVLDISDPSNPVSVGSTAGSGGNTVNQPLDIAVQGHYIYVADNGANKFMTFDVKNPASPANGGNLAITSPWAVAVQGRYAYVLGSASFNVIDVSTPASPVLVGTATSNGAQTLSIVNGSKIVVSGKYAYIGDDNNNKLVIFDISNPTTPRAVGSYTCDFNVTDVAVQGSYAYIACGSTSAGRLKVVDISNPTSPSLVSSNSDTMINAAFDIAVSGRYVYVTSQTTGKLIKYDISNPNVPTLVGENSDSVPSTGQNIFVTVSGLYAYVTSNGGSGKLGIYSLGGISTQQFDANNANLGSLNLSTNGQVGGDFNVSGSVSVGQNAQINGSLGVNGSAEFQVSTDSTTAFQIQNAAGNNGNLVLVNTVNVNRITNASAETDATNWAINTGSGTAPASTTSQALYGNSALSINTSATSHAGAKYNTTTLLSTSTTYSLSFWAKIGSGTFTVEAGRADNDTFAGESTCTLNASTVSTTWTRFTCSFTTGTVTTGGYIFIRQSDSTSRTWYVDGVQLEQASAPTNYKEGSVQFNGTITNPIVFQNQSDTALAFQIQNAAGTTLFNIDTSGSIITIAGTDTTFATLTLSEAHFKSSQTNKPTIALGTCSSTGAESVTNNSTDSAGSFATGTLGTGGACTITVTFRRAYGGAPKSVIIVPKNTNAADTSATGPQPYVSSTTTTTFVVTFRTAVGTGSDYQYYYWVVE
jgi:hypothetical protein